MSRTRIGRMAWAMGQEWIAVEQAERQALFGRGEAPPAGQVPASMLYLEADGVWISLQREARRKAEVRVGTMYTGKQRCAAGRNRLLDKTSLARLVQDSDAWEELLLGRADRVYDLAGTQQVIVGGDGGAWVQHSADRFELPSTYPLDRFHLYREARRAAPGTGSGLLDLVHRATQAGLEAVEEELRALIRAAPSGGPQERLLKFYGYMRDNADGILDYRRQLGLDCTKYPSLGAIEGNVDKLVVQRMKGRGKSWRLAGAQAMLALCEHRSELASLALPVPMPSQRKAIVAPRRRRQQREEIWLQGGVPAIHGSAENHPWAKRLARQVHGQARIPC